jgi:hypothetical protein
VPADDTADHVPAPLTAGEIVVAEQQEGLLVGGEPEAVEHYLAQLRDTAGHAVRVVGIDKAALGNTTGLLAGAVAVLGISSRFVQLHPESIQALRAGRRIPGTDGFFRMMTRGADNKFLQQLQWKPATLGPEHLMSMQMVAVQLALKSAITEVEQSVRRVEGKVEAVLQLAQAHRAGNVLGIHTTVSRKLAYLEEHGPLPDADWDAIASLGPTLNITVEQLRNHVTRVLNSLDAELPVQDRAEKLAAALDTSLIGETLGLLVVAEEALYKWQRLRLARVEATQPEHLPKVLQDERDLLEHQLAEDGKLYQLARRVTDEFAKSDALEGFRFRSAQRLTRERDRLRADLGAFAQARLHHAVIWEDLQTPGVAQAAEETVRLAKRSAGRAIEAAGKGLIDFSHRFADQAGEKSPVGDDESPTPEPAE